jgi:ubiquinone/menaquinone biosynthesis C-methylase UbiE
MNTVSRFSDRVANYVKYRPGYPPEVLAFFKKDLGLTVADIIADVGSGTGISSELFLENGNTVYGIEPNDAMREAAETRLEKFPNFHPLKCTAENISLPDAFVNIIVSAQAFHWFDRQKARKEFTRVLRPGGYVVLMWNERQLDTTPFLTEYERFLLSHGSDYAAVRHENITAGVLEDFFRQGFSQKTFENRQIFDFEGLRGRMLSASYMPAETDQRFPAIEAGLKQLFDRHASAGTVEILYDTNVFYSQF